MEKPKQSEIITFLSGLGLLATVYFSAFGKDVRKEIGRRDSWTCQDCGKKFKDGFMVHAAHESDKHHKTHPQYYVSASGKIRCIDCHEKQHSQGTTLGSRGDNYALSKLKTTDRRTFDWRKKNVKK